MVNAQTKILGILRSRAFFVAIMALFAIESVWIAVSAAFPMVFDENTHLGIIQIYAHQWSPLFLHQPAHAEFAGALVHNPSYLYHYLMSFPYRVLAGVTHDQMVQVIGLRFINVALFGSALVLFRKLLLKTKVSPAIVHLALLLFVLTPVVPLLAGQINYDNLVMPLVALALLIATSVSSRLRDGRLPIAQIGWLLTLCMFSSLVKFEFLPIFAAVVLWLGWQIWRQRRELQLSQQLKAGWRISHWSQKLLVGLPLIVAAGLFIQMYGVNLALYHTPMPDCDQILTRQQCAAYAPWQRDQLAIAHKVPVNGNPALFAMAWLYRMFVMMFYTSSGGANQTSAWYLSINPLPIIFVSALAIFGLGAVLVVKYRRTLFAGYEHFGFLIFVSLLYAACLWLRNYHDFLVVGQKIAINGRYLFPIILPAMLVIGLAYRQLFGHRAHLKVALAAATCLLFLQGGGALSYINASNSNWYWENPAIARLNQKAQHLLRPFMVMKQPIHPFSLNKG